MKNSIKDYMKMSIVYRLDDEAYKEFGIPKLCPINDQEELWAYAVFDRHPEITAAERYIVSNYGRIYDTKKNRLLKTSGEVWDSSHRYKYQGVSIKNSGYFVHRLVALAFYPIDETRPYVNHKDGCPEHNYLWNLEWCNNSENMLHAIRTGLKNEQRGEERSNSKWTDNEVRIICNMMEDGHKATYIYNELKRILNDDPKVQYERVRALCKHIRHRTHWTHISKDYNIDFSSHNYSKEQKSVENAKTREKHVQYAEEEIIFNAKALSKNNDNTGTN